MMTVGCTGLGIAQCLDIFTITTAIHSVKGYMLLNVSLRKLQAPLRHAAVLDPLTLVVPPSAAKAGEWG